MPLIRAAEALEAAHDVPPALAATAIANVVLGVAFALFLCAAMTLRPAMGWRAALAWGIAGYVVFFVAPAIGLPPELPGTESAALHERQLWWAFAAANTAAGLALIVFGKTTPLRALGVVVLVLPHLVGAPHRGEVAADFVRATSIANAAFWLALGALAAFFMRDAPGVPRNRSAAPLP